MEDADILVKCPICGRTVLRGNLMHAGDQDVCIICHQNFPNFPISSAKNGGSGPKNPK